MLPAVLLGIIAPTGGDQMQMGMVLAIAPMRVEHRDVPAPKGLAPDLAIEVIQALRPAAHQGAQQDRSVVVEGRAEHGWDCQDDVAINDTLVEHFAHLAHPVIHVDFGTSQAQRRFTAHCHPMSALATLQATVFDIAHLLWVATRQHLGHQALVVVRLIAWMGVGKPVPALGKDLLEDHPGPRGGCYHRGAPSGGVGLVGVQRLYHASAASSTPHQSSPGLPHLPLSSLSHGDVWDRKNEKSYTIKVTSTRGSSTATRGLRPIVPPGP